MTKENISRTDNKDSGLLSVGMTSNKAFMVPEEKSSEFLERFTAKKVDSSTKSFWNECRNVSQKNKK